MGWSRGDSQAQQSQTEHLLRQRPVLHREVGRQEERVIQRRLLRFVLCLRGRGEVGGPSVVRCQALQFLAAALSLGFRQLPVRVVACATGNPGLSAPGKRGQFERSHHFVRYRVGALRHVAVLREVLETREVCPLVEPFPNGLLHAIVAPADQEGGPDEANRETGIHEVGQSNAPLRSRLRSEHIADGHSTQSRPSAR